MNDQDAETAAPAERLTDEATWDAVRRSLPMLTFLEVVGRLHGETVAGAVERGALLALPGRTGGPVYPAFQLNSVGGIGPVVAEVN